MKSKTLKKSVNVLFNQAKRVKNGKDVSDQRLPAAIKVTKTFEDDPKAFESAMKELKKYRNHVLGPKTEKKTKSTKKQRKKLQSMTTDIDNVRDALVHPYWLGLAQNNLRLLKTAEQILARVLSSIRHGSTWYRSEVTLHMFLKTQV